MAVVLLLAACSNSMNTTGGNHKLEGTSWKLTGLSSIKGALPATARK